MQLNTSQQGKIDFSFMMRKWKKEHKNVLFQENQILFALSAIKRRAFVIFI